MRRFSPQTFTLISIMLALATVVRAGGLLPSGQAEYEFVYDRLERECILDISRFDSQLRPWSDDDNRFSFGPFDHLRNQSSRRLSLFGFAGESFRTARYQRGVGIETIRGGFAATPFRHLSLYANFLLDEERAEAADYTGKKWRGLAGGVEQGFVHYGRGRFDVLFGRFASSWGPRGSLLLDSRQALDGLEYRLRWGKLTLSYRLARLDGLSPERDSVGQFENRFFAAHRLDVHFSERVRVGFFEAVVFGGLGRGIDLYYLNPLIFFHADQLNEDIDDNSLLGFDATVYPAEGVRFYGQLLVDDFQIDSETQGDEEPDQYGVMAGVDAVDLVDRWDLAVRYSRVTNWTFNQLRERNRFLVNGEPIGGGLGNDYEAASLSAKRWLSDGAAVSVLVDFVRQGEGRIDADYTSPWLDADGGYDEPFPTGVVERTVSLSARVQAFLFDRFFLDLQAGVEDLSNNGHVAGNDKTQPFVLIRLSAFGAASLLID